MQIERLKQLIQEMELDDAFEGVEAEMCSVCCQGWSGGNEGC
jgi:hypothetical protein